LSRSLPGEAVPHFPPCRNHITALDLRAGRSKGSVVGDPASAGFQGLSILTGFTIGGFGK